MFLHGIFQIIRAQRTASARRNRGAIHLIWAGSDASCVACLMISIFAVRRWFGGGWKLASMDVLFLRCAAPDVETKGVDSRVLMFQEHMSNVATLSASIISLFTCQFN